MGNFSNAFVWDTKAWDVEKEVYGPEHPRSALCEARIAVDEQGLGKTKESQIHRQEAETVLKAVLGDSHPLISLIDPVETQRYNVLFPIGLI